ncbi:aryl-alcohol dehydrogenase [Moniliophthora roreri]|nr:aryl-alcohol dehydrogenase [Moniliophthora roreri]
MRWIVRAISCGNMFRDEEPVPRAPYRNRQSTLIMTRYQVRAGYVSHSFKPLSALATTKL